ncbi:hypothetical protein EML15_00070 [Corynebacterium sp. sy017]|uniref:hypothetical protein n=1 Tax=unclassified Corynebacterium TaxID=2624378 RepID=UPI001185E62E|nr:MULTISPECIES: hypothetical protein [unclassified Corynebacterium]MBP3087550.1 hypothetical protein [Corynebacterium sp. sy017]TSD92128.1 hypothetical protein ELY17_00070 [Corynebacterium sp. SY003]
MNKPMNAAPKPHDPRKTHQVTVEELNQEFESFFSQVVTSLQEEYMRLDQAHSVLHKALG